MSYQSGHNVGNYRLVRLIGQGNFGSVYLAEHIHLQTQAAVKLLRQQIDAPEQYAFLHEARIIAALKHAHIVRLLDFGFEQGTPYLVTEYAPHGTLRHQHPPGNRVPVATVCSYIQQIADGLQYAHDRHIIHRDLKPDNLLLDEHMQVVISDFGTALTGSRQLTAAEIAGTAAYMAPEQFAGKPRRASDQYALGIMVYEWLTGTVPFIGTLVEIAGQHQCALLPSLRDRNPSVSSEVEQVVCRALAKDPTQRFASVQEFAAAVARAVTTPVHRCTRPAAPAGQPMLPVSPIVPTQDGKQTVLVFQPPVSLAAPPLPAGASMHGAGMVLSPVNPALQASSAGSVPSVPAVPQPRWPSGEAPVWFLVACWIAWIVWMILMCANGVSIGDILIFRFSARIPVWSWLILFSSIGVFFGSGWIAGKHTGSRDVVESLPVLGGITILTWILSACMITSISNTSFTVGSLIVGALFPGILLCILTVPIGLGATALGALLGARVS